MWKMQSSFFLSVALLPRVASVAAPSRIAIEGEVPPTPTPLRLPRPKASLSPTTPRSSAGQGAMRPFASSSAGCEAVHLRRLLTCSGRR
jgi:hypothetical protein